ncbi:MAG: 50S ribosomal protein L2 [Chitinivibrionales bacterium]|nr:50S ribosomal protein L2 [Chitinivibrionales bacterium]
MPIKTYNPVTPTLRYKTTNTFEQVTTDTPHEPLLRTRKRSSGRNNTGRITVRRRGGGHKRHYRVVDFKRNKDGIPATVETVEYDPNRTCFIALVKYADGERRYVLATTKMAPGMKLQSGETCEFAEGNTMLLGNVPLGTVVHNIELMPGAGGQIARSAGSYAEVMAKEGDFVQLKMPSGEIRNIRQNCRATIGQVSNAEHGSMVLGSAGRTRHTGRRPKVRGVAMNPIDHPMGGGEGRTSGGGHPVSPWGQPAKGLRTRSRKKQSSKYIVRRRKK